MVSDEKAIGWEPYSVPLEVAQERITNWIDADPYKPVKSTDMRAFVVRREDFVELLAQHDTEFIRLYLGRKEQENEPDAIGYVPACCWYRLLTGTICTPKRPDPDDHY